MPVVLVTSRSFSSGPTDLEARLAARGCQVIRGPADHEPEALREALAEAEGWIAGTGTIDAAHLEAAPRLKVIARYGVGFEAVDVAAAAARGIIVTNTPGANTNAVAEHTVALLLAALRAVPAGDRRVRAHDWTVIRGRELGSLTVGIVGFGRIGQSVARMLGGFGCDVLAADPFLTDEQVTDAGARPASFEDMASVCDVVSLHSPGGQTLVDEPWLSRVRSGMVLVNTARPELVDEDAAAAGLRSGVLAGFAADTLLGDTSGADSPLLEPALADQVIVTPHFGAQTMQAIDQMGSMAVQNVLAVLSGAAPVNPVSAPAPAPAPQRPQQQR